MISRFQLKLAARHIHAGNIIAYPTESVIGLGCNPLNESAVNRLLSIKNRSVDKGLILIASDIEQLFPFIEITQQQFEKLSKDQGKPTTWLVQASAFAPAWITGRHHKIAVRLTKHQTARQLCEITGYPLVSTSANRSGHKPAKTLLRTKQYFSDLVNFYLAGNIEGYKKPSEIRDLESDKIIRAS